jgi:hypothetical protein
MICGDLKVLYMLLVSKLVIPRTHVLCVNGTGEQEVNTGSKKSEHQGHLLNLGGITFCEKVLVDPKKILLPPLHINLLKPIR